MPQLLPLLAVLIAGLGVAIQPPTNAALAKASGSVWLAALISFAVALTGDARFMVPAILVVMFLGLLLLTLFAAQWRIFPV